ncbi:uncharacterized protein WM294_005384 [Sarcoramphus papa]
MTTSQLGKKSDNPGQLAHSRSISPLMCSRMRTDGIKGPAMVHFLEVWRASVDSSSNEKQVFCTVSAKAEVISSPGGAWEGSREWQLFLSWISYSPGSSEAENSTSSMSSKAGSGCDGPTALSGGTGKESSYSKRQQNSGGCF